MPDNEELFEEQDFSKKKLDFNVWKKIIAFMKPLKKEVIIAVTSMAFLAATDAIYPLFSKYAIDQILRPDANNVLHPELGNLKWFILMYVGFILAGLALVYLFILFAGKVQAELAYQIRKKAFLHLQELPFSYYDRTRTGWIMARMTADTRNLSDILSWGIIDVTWGLFMMLILTAVMFVINWKLALIAIAVVPILSLISKWFQKYILKTYRDIRKVNSKITGSYNEGITGVMTTKTLVLERDNEDDFRLLTGDMRSKSIRAAVIHGLYFPTVIFLIALGTAAVYYAGGIWVMEAGLSISTLILFTSYVWEFFDPVNNIAETYVRLQQAEASAERVVSLIESQPDIVDTPEVVAKYGTLFDYKRENFEPLRGDVEFRDVSFKYAVGERVLDRFNLQVRAGQSIALVGHTGAGKSTIVNLLCRFYEPTEGTILIDGIDYKNRS
ncbi:MAG TPA: ABC transporter transmembrane domain-containing protein, partial [Bacillota bacterium]|nr:ABC transporter transmembrane domain-containing protein [Bacillota bacterium]